MIYYIEAKYPYYSQTFIKGEVEYFSRQTKVKVFSLYPFKFRYLLLLSKLNSNGLYILIKYLFLILFRSKSIKEIIYYSYALLYGLIISQKVRNFSTIRCHLPKYAGLSSLIVTQLKKCKFIPVFHSYGLFTHNPFIKEICNNSYYIETISQYNKQCLKNITDKKIQVIHCGIDPDQLPKIPKKEDMAIFVGRLHETKGLDEVFKIFSNMDIPLILIGGGKIEKYKKMAKRSNVKANFLGVLTRSKTWEYISKAKVLILPSKINRKNGDRDGIPIVLMEAMALRTIVLTKKVSGIPELVIARNTGYLFKDIQDAKSILKGIFQIYPQNIAEKGFEMVKNEFNNETLFEIKGKNSL
ncbi:glycosyltransferase family 4 protein [bacterium]|nr:glycosyltransferase family 4 protein [bacterium]